MNKKNKDQDRGMKLETVRGMRDFLPGEKIDRDRIISIIRKTFEKYGFVPMETPVLESASLLKGKYGEEEKLIYEFKDRGGRQLAMRYDLTVPFVRVVATRSFALPFKRYAIDKVWRYDRPQKGRYREFYQCDVDIIGVKDSIADAEIIACINEALSEHGLSAAWETAQNNGSVTVTCKITHIMGHSESTSLTAAPDNTGSKNPIQAIGSTVTYLQRYTLLALTGLATYEQDDDGGKPEQPTPMENSMKIVCAAFEQFQEEYKTSLAKGFAYDFDKFTKAIQKHFKGLPTHKKSIQKILKTVKPEEVLVELKEQGCQRTKLNQ